MTPAERKLLVSLSQRDLSDAERALLRDVAKLLLSIAEGEPEHRKPAAPKPTIARPDDAAVARAERALKRLGQRKVG